MLDQEAPVIAHLGELRKRLIYTALAFVFFLVITSFFVADIYAYLTREIAPMKLIILGPSDSIKIYFMLATVTSLIGFIPFAAWQVWLFVKPALNRRERRSTLKYFPALVTCFAFGILFGYYVIFPNVFRFLQSIGTHQMQIAYEATNYFNFLLYLTLPFGILFEMPIVMMFLTSVGVVNPYFLVKLRKYAYSVLVVLGIVISPPEFLSEVITSIPFLVLFEVSMILSKRVYQNKLKRRQQQEEDVSATSEMITVRSRKDE